MKTNGKQGRRDPVTSLLNPPDVTHSQPSQACPREAAKLTETLLLVDDDPAVRKLEAEILSRRGYRVLQAQSAEEALKVARQAVVIHRLITDFSMPQADGLELSHRFRSLHPQTPVLIISGSLPVLGDGTRDLDHAVLLARPVTWNELLDTVRLLLDAAVVGLVRKPWAHD